MIEGEKGSESAALFNLAKTALSCVNTNRLDEDQSVEAPTFVVRKQNKELEWRRFLTVEERQQVRVKIKEAYQTNCSSYEDLLQTVVAIEEELLHVAAPTRLDYFKSGCRFDKRVAQKRKQLKASSDTLPSNNQNSRKRLKSVDEASSDASMNAQSTTSTTA